MLINFFKVAFRQLLRHKGYSLINIFSVGAGMACSIIIFMLVWHEATYDRFHEDYERMYRVGLEGSFVWDDDPRYSVSANLGPALKEQAPKVLDMTRIAFWGRNSLIVNEEENFLNSDAIHADENFFRFFQFDLINGHPGEVLANPHNAVITEEIALKLFGHTDIAGETINVGRFGDFTITGIAAQPPRNSHIDFTVILSFESLYTGRYRESIESWGNFNSSLYVKLAEEADVEGFSGKADDIMAENIDMEALKEHGVEFNAFARRIDKVHISELPEGGFKPNVNRAYLYILGGISLLVLVLGCINYVIHSTARTVERAKEVGIRKVIGAGRKQLIFHFMGESFISVFLAFILALIIIETNLPLVNRIFDTSIRFYSSGNLPVIISLPLLLILTGLMAGAYPSVYLSGIYPVKIMKHQHLSFNGKSSLRKILIIFQVMVSVALVVCVIVMHRQFRFIEQKELGFEPSGRIVVQLNSAETRSRYHLIKENTGNLSGVNGVAASDKYPGTSFSTSPLYVEGYDDAFTMARHVVDYDFINVMGIEVVEGRGFSEEFAADQMTALVNETAVRTFGWEDPLNKIVGWYRRSMTDYDPFNVIGVVGDYHFKSLHETVEPLVLFQLDHNPEFITIWIEDERFSETVDRIRSVWNQLFMDDVFIYFPLEGTFAEYYEDERKMEGMIGFFTILVLVISSLGLFALATFTTTNRTKEIAVRKVFGANARTITLLFVKQFGVWIFVSNIIGWVIAWFLMQRWLQDFAYRTDLNDPVIYLTALIVTSLIAISVTAYQTVRIALTNPASTLKYE